MSIFFIVTIASKARFASAPPAAIASVSARGVICHERPHRSLHQPHADRVAAWARRNQVIPSRIIAGEFGVDRRVAGARDFLDDAVARLEARGWHWAFYAFRPDGWSGLDYEMGTAPIGAAYWKAVESGTDPETLKRRGPNPLWEVLTRAIKSPRRVAVYGDR